MAITGNAAERLDWLSSAVGPTPYVQLLSGVATEIEIHGRWDIVKFMFQFMGKFFWTRMNPFIPVWHTPEALALKEGDLKALFQDVDQGRIRVILDPASPFPFSEEGVRKAMALQKSIHAHGKVVIQIADE
jgi:NADPH:quinone reductase-like Zn-dependent oxidoreductase